MILSDNVTSKFGFNYPGMTITGTAVGGPGFSLREFWGHVAGRARSTSTSKRLSMQVTLIKAAGDGMLAIEVAVTGMAQSAGPIPFCGS